MQFRQKERRLVRVHEKKRRLMSKQISNRLLEGDGGPLPFHGPPLVQLRSQIDRLDPNQHLPDPQAINRIIK